MSEAATRLSCGLADLPNDDGKNNREQKTEQRPGKRHDDFVERRNVWKFFRAVLHLALDGFHRGHLRQRNVAACRNPAERVFDAVNILFPNRFAEPNGETFDFQAAPARREEMSQLMHADDEIENQHDFERDKDVM